MRKFGGFRLKKLFNWNLSIPMRRVVGSSRGREGRQRQESINMYNIRYGLAGTTTKWIINWIEIFGAGGRLIASEWNGFRYARMNSHDDADSCPFRFIQFSLSVIQPINTCLGWKLHDSQLVRFVRFRLNSGNLVETNLSSLRRFEVYVERVSEEIE